MLCFDAFVILAARSNKSSDRYAMKGGADFAEPATGLYCSGRFHYLTTPQDYLGFMFMTHAHTTRFSVDHSEIILFYESTLNQLSNLVLISHSYWYLKVANEINLINSTRKCLVSQYMT